MGWAWLKYATGLNQGMQAEKLEAVRAKLKLGMSLTKASSEEGLNKGAVFYHLGKTGERWLISRHADTKRDPRDKRILNPEIRNQAKYYLDSCHLHMKPVYRHYRQGLGITLLAIVEKPSRVVGLKLILGEANPIDWARFLREVGLTKGSVLLSDVGNEFCGSFPETVEALGLKLSRARGWIGNTQTKPWVEGIFGLFQNRYLRPVLGEHVENLSLEQVFTECHTLIKDMLKDLGQSVQMSPIRKEEKLILA